MGTRVAHFQPVVTETATEAPVTTTARQALSRSHRRSKPTNCKWWQQRSPHGRQGSASPSTRAVRSSACHTLQHGSLQVACVAKQASGCFDFGSTSAHSPSVVIADDCPQTQTPSCSTPRSSHNYVERCFRCSSCGAGCGAGVSARRRDRCSGRCRGVAGVAGDFYIAWRQRDTVCFRATSTKGQVPYGGGVANAPGEVSTAKHLEPSWLQHSTRRRRRRRRPTIPTTHKL